MFLHERIYISFTQGVRELISNVQGVQKSEMVKKY